MHALAVALVAAVLLGCAALCVSAGRWWRKSDVELAWSLLDRFPRLDLLAAQPEACEAPKSVERLAPQAAKTRARKRRVSQLRKKKVAARDGWVCQRCHMLVDHTFEIDHVIPVSQGGSDHESNLRCLCRACHGIVTAEQRLGG